MVLVIATQLVALTAAGRPAGRIPPQDDAPSGTWAFQPLRRPRVPSVASDPAQPLSAVDAFIGRKLAERNLSPAPPADRRSLIRRATLDLTGLPPTPEQVEEFLADTSSNAFQKVIDRLLDSPRYAEQWARHWLDVVRYADTSGFSNDYERPNAWRYRDYVIRSFLQDKPFSRFVIEQLAGDELEPNNPEMLVATGFLRMGPWEHTGMSVAAVTRQHFLDDVTAAVGVTFLGLGLRCARCHDHKFDPIPTVDYYRLQAVFAPVQFADRDAPFQEWENTAGFDAGRARTQRLLAESQQHRQAILETHRAAVAQYLEQHSVDDVKDLPADQRPDQYLGLTTQESVLRNVYGKRISYYQRQLKRYQPLALGIYNGPPNRYSSARPSNPMPADTGEEIQDVFVLAGGSLAAPREKVTPGVLSAINRMPTSGQRRSSNNQSPRVSNQSLGTRTTTVSENGTPVLPLHDSPERKGTSIPATMHGRRLALARWLTEPRNPLTARVIVNRVWQHHFAGQGIVSTPNNFGKMGGRPTHPELLDWLAAWFIDNGWSIKKLHRLIMTSAVYQRSAHHPNHAAVHQIDPNNEWLAYYPPRRMSAEELRDSMLAVSGELSLEMGGPGIFPEINPEVALQPRHTMGTVAPAYQPSPTRRQRNRRTIYTFRYRTLADPLLEVFNQPGTDLSCERRDQTTVTPQVFALLNSRWSHRRALAMAHRLQQTDDEPIKQIDRAFQLTYGRGPTPAERRQCLEHLAAMTEHHRRSKPIPIEMPTHVTRTLVDELTGRTVEWTEELDQLANYEHDLRAQDVGPQTRALADLCLVLLNSNEFVYVY